MDSIQAHPVVVTNLSKAFAHNVAVKNLSMVVPRGSVYGFLGSNGAGKTTTIRLLLGLFRPTSGTVALFGEPLWKSRQSLLARVGSMVESPSLYPHLTGRENLEIVRRLRGLSATTVDRALSLVNMQKDGLRKIREYSLGMKQRLGVAIALLPDPELLILDEPTNGLDPQGISEMRELLRTLTHEAGATVFLSSHLLSEVQQIATHIGIIQSGELIFQSSMERLRDDNLSYYELTVSDAARGLDIAKSLNLEVTAGSGNSLKVKSLDRDIASQLNSRLVVGGVSVYSMGIVRPSLEEFFLGMTDSVGGEA